MDWVIRRPRTRKFAFLLLSCPVSGGCGRNLATDSQQDASSGTDAGGAAPVPGDAAYVEGEPYLQGVYRCCAKGEGRACCGEMTGKCFEYGGAIGECSAEGETVEAKEICTHCCAGLTRAEISAPAATTGECESVGPPSLFVCVHCGDGVCSEDENVCNCDEDCSRSM
jgi:hypothetical protein